MTLKEFKIISLSASGQIVEFYDFMIFVLLSNVVSPHFFNGSVYAKDMYLFGVFALGYIVRPLGGIIFGHFGDTIGRKITFITTILIVSIATSCMGLIPDYKTIGLLAPAIFIFLRIIQGISLGGELPGAMAFVYEHMEKHKKTFGMSFIFSATHVGYLLAFFVVTILYASFSQHQLASYGWRIAFLIGGFLGFVICLFRTRISDTPVFENLLKHNQILRYPVRQLFYKNFRNCILGILIFIFPAYGSIFLLALPNILSSYLNYYPREYILEVSTLSVIILAVCSIAFSYMIDKFKVNIHSFFVFMSLLIIMLIFPLFIMLQMKNNFFFLFAYIVFGITYGMIAVVYHILAKLFPSTVEYSGLGLTINIGSISGVGLIPLISTIIFFHTGSLYSIACTLVVIIILPTIAGVILLLRPPNKKSLQDLDNEIRELYNLEFLFEKDSLSLKEERIFKNKLDAFADKIVNDKILLDDIIGDSIPHNTSNITEISKLNMNNLGRFNKDKQKELYQRCKHILISNANDPHSVINKYKSLLINSVGNKYYTYFYTRLVIKELMAINKNEHLTANDINLVIKQRLETNTLVF